MKRIILAVALVFSLSLAGCGNSLEEDLDDNFPYLKKENDVQVFPEEMLGDGRKFWGNGYDPDSRDLFTLIEEKIWGDEHDRNE